MAEEAGMDLDEEEVLGTLHAAYHEYPELWLTTSASPLDGVDADPAEGDGSPVTPSKA